MGKGIEKTMLSVIAGQTKQFGVKKIKAVYKKTKKNASIKDFLPDNGFMLIAEDGDDKHFEFDLSQKELVLPKHITIK
jgi:predicted enzyme involved in methoxymalonyl-ACP biosynthesis